MLNVSSKTTTAEAATDSAADSAAVAADGQPEKASSMHEGLKDGEMAQRQAALVGAIFKVRCKNKSALAGGFLPYAPSPPGKPTKQNGKVSDDAVYGTAPEIDF